jgi:hypothetical protein
MNPNIHHGDTETQRFRNKNSGDSSVPSVNSVVKKRFRFTALDSAHILRPSHPHRVPLRTIEPADASAAPTAARAECPTCGKVFCETAIVSDAPFYSEPFGTWALTRKLFCDHCDHLIVWQQTCRPDGSERGPVVCGPSLLREPRAIDRFLAAHPEGAGVA